MIAGAALLVLIGLGLFAGGVFTGATALYWACVGVCALAVVLLVVARLRVPAGSRPSVPDGPARGSAPAADPGRGDSPAGRGTPVAEPVAAEPVAREVAAAEPPAGEPAVGDRHGTSDDAGPAVPPPALTPAPTPNPAAAGVRPPAVDGAGDPAEEDVEVTDLLLVVDLADEVLVVDEHPRYHLDGCPWPAGRETVPLPVTEARADGFTPCAVCGPDAHLAGVERARRAARRNRTHPRGDQVT